MDVLELIPRLIRASLENDRKALESFALLISKKIKKDNPELASEITKALVYASNNTSTFRSIDLQNLPVDKESRFSLLSATEPLEVEDPIVDDYLMQQLKDFLKERELVDLFLEEDITPSSSILLVGRPGVGKTYITTWLSYMLHLPLVTLNLASSISSYLGRSGQNIQSVFSFAKSNNTILFLDELDAIAKKRDDAGDLGELKRLVNVLLKELEDCPSSCVIIGATNHPELLDKAIWRRFDRVLNVNMPTERERMKLIERHLGRFIIEIDENIIDYIVKNTNDMNSADICKLCEHIKRQFIMNKEYSRGIIALAEIFKVKEDLNKEEKLIACSTLREKFPNLSLRDISFITRIPLTTVSRYISKSSKEGRS